MFRAAVQAVLRWGVRSEPRGHLAYELPCPAVLTLTDPHRVLIASDARRPFYRFGLVEAAWILSGSQDLAGLAELVPRYREFSDDGQTLWGAYGPRVTSQLAHVLETLRRDPDSRQAVMTTWRPMVPAANRAPDHDAWFDKPEWDGASWRSRDVPCTVAWMFLLRNGRLNLTVTMRSHDAWLGFPYDLLSFTTVQRVVASALGVYPGEYRLFVQNLHVYDRDLDRAADLMDEARLEDILPMPHFGTTYSGKTAHFVTQRWARIYGKSELGGEYPDSVYSAACRNDRSHVGLQYLSRLGR